MASPNTGGYDQEFLDPPAKLKEFECPLCLLVTREPTLTSCCGQHFCQSCINRIITDRKPCPLCKQLRFSTFLDKKQKRKVLELKVNCSMKLRGCSWTGELRDLDPHTDTGNGNCQFVYVTCPNKCGETCQRRLMGSHLSSSCMKRPFTCKYCKFWCTFDVVCKHYGQCTKFPLLCPNKCEVESVERGKMTEHLSECPLQLVDCELAHAGCSEKIERNKLREHMKDNVQQHLLCVFTASQSQIKELENRVEEVRREKNHQLEEVRRERDEQLKEVRRERDEQLKEVRRERDKQLEEVRRERDVGHYTDPQAIGQCHQPGQYSDSQAFGQWRQPGQYPDPQATGQLREAGRYHNPQATGQYQNAGPYHNPMGQHHSAGQYRDRQYTPAATVAATGGGKDKVLCNTPGCSFRGVNELDGLCPDCYEDTYLLTKP